MTSGPENKWVVGSREKSRRRAVGSKNRAIVTSISVTPTIRGFLIHL